MANVLTVEQPVGESFEVTSDNMGKVAMRIGPNTSATGGAVTKVLFVDEANAPASGRVGSILAPFATIQEAINQAAANVWDDAVILIAPEIYSDDLTIPHGVFQTLVVRGWSEQFPGIEQPNMPGLTGTITITGAAFSSTNVQFVNVAVLGNIVSGDPATNNVSVAFINSRIAGTVNGFQTQVYLLDSYVTGDLLAQDPAGLTITTDGVSWAKLCQSGTVLSADYTRTFLDTGAEVASGSLVANGVAIGDRAIVQFPFPGVRHAEYAICTLTAADSATEFNVTFRSTSTDVVFFLLENFSRVSTNFDEACDVLVLHSAMPRAPAP